MEHQKSFSCIEFTVQCHHHDRDYLLFDSTSHPGTVFLSFFTLDRSLKFSPGVPSLSPLSHPRTHPLIPLFPSFSTFSRRFSPLFSSIADAPNLPLHVSRSPMLQWRSALPFSLGFWPGLRRFIALIAAFVLVTLHRIQSLRFERRIGGRYRRSAVDSPRDGRFDRLSRFVCTWIVFVPRGEHNKQGVPRGTRAGSLPHDVFLVYFE